MSKEEERAKSGWVREVTLKLARRLYGRRMQDSLRVIKAMLEEKESFEFFGDAKICLTFRELLQKTGLSEWRLRKAIDFLISIEVIEKTKDLLLPCREALFSFLDRSRAISCRESGFQARLMRIIE